VGARRYFAVLAGRQGFGSVVRDRNTPDTISVDLEIYRRNFLSLDQCSFCEYETRGLSEEGIWLLEYSEYRKIYMSRSFTWGKVYQVKKYVIVVYAIPTCFATNLKFVLFAFLYLEKKKSN
jgi:hypothetical protein